MSVSKSPLRTPKPWRPLTVNHHLKVLLLSYMALVTKPLIRVALCNTSGLYRRYKMTYREQHYENMANTVLQVNVLRSIAWKPQTRERHWGAFRGILNAWEPSETTVRNIDQVWLSAPKSPVCVCKRRMNAVTQVDRNNVCSSIFSKNRFFLKSLYQINS